MNDFLHYLTHFFFVNKGLCIEMNELSENGLWTAQIRWLSQHHVRLADAGRLFCQV